ncbi:MAG: hypothetical protein GF317_20605 [Candidatus Lokiarchaeota archaeon]|nr:hypothetical protein [Candidatus Lokiarchaeota archaeon]MBD3201866.1 hypothetical protein [Candidatus Lokiarchaeota archaeon]
MNLQIPRNDNSKLMIYIWKIIGIPKIKREELIYEISFNLFLMTPHKALETIQKSISEGILVENEDNSLSLSKTLSGKLNRWQQERKNEIQQREEHIQKRGKIVANFEKESSSDFNTILKAFLDKGTINRAVTVSDSAFNLKTIDKKEGKIEAEVAGSKEDPYYIKISKNNKILSHNCHDFVSRRAPDKKFCKHLAKLFLLLKEKEESFSIKFLNYIANYINEWEFGD